MLSISQFSRLSHITSKTLRYYDEIGLFKPSYINEENGYRYYEASQLKTIFLIQKLKDYEFTLDEIKQVLNDHTFLLPLLENKKEMFSTKINDYLLLNSTIEKDITTFINGGFTMFNEVECKIEISDSPELTILSLRRTIDVKYFSEMLNELFEMVKTEKVTVAGPPLVIYHSQEHIPESSDIEMGIPVLEANNHTRVLSAMKCAKLSYKGVYDEIPKLYAQLAQWVEDNGYEINGPVFEFYVTDPYQTKPEDNEIEIYAPVTK